MLTTAAPSFIKLLIHKRHMLRMFFVFFAKTNLHEIYLWFLFIFNDAFA